jgi:hypothetical protein
MADAKPPDAKPPDAKPPDAITFSRLYWFLIIAITALLMILQGLRSYYLEIEYYDSYDNFHNALSVLGDKKAWFFSYRSPLPYLSITPIICLRMSGFLSHPFLLIHLYYLLFILLSALILGALYRSCKLSRFSSLFGLLIVLGNPLSLHYQVFALPAIFVLMTVPLGFLLFLRAYKKPSYSAAVLTGVAIGLATLARFQLIVFGPVLALFWLMNKPRSLSWRRALRMLVVYGATALLLWNAVFWIVGACRGIDYNPPWAGFYVTWRFAMGMRQINDQGIIPGFYVTVLVRCFGPVLLCALAIGVLTALKRRCLEDKFFLSVGLSFYLISTFTAAYESRYLLPLFPVLGYFFALSLDTLASLSKRRHKGYQLLSLMAPGVVLLALCAGSWWEIKSWAHPFYRHNFGEALKEKLLPLAKSSGITPVLWRGAYHGEFAAHPPLHPEERFHRLFHFGHKALMYHLNPTKKFEVIQVQGRGLNYIRLPAYVISIESEPQQISNTSRPPCPHALVITSIERIQRSPEEALKFLQSEASTGPDRDVLVYARSPDSMVFLGSWTKEKQLPEQTIEVILFRRARMLFRSEPGRQRASR